MFVLLFFKNKLNFVIDLNFDKAIEKSKMEVKPDTKFELIIKFAPKYVGIHREAVTIDFESRGTIFERKVS